jgi:hypothetical protein
LTVKALSKADNKSFGNATITVAKDPGVPGLELLEANQIITIDGIEWIKVKESNDKKYALLLKRTDLPDTTKFGASNRYEESTIQTKITNWYKNTAMPTLKQYAVKPDPLSLLKETSLPGAPAGTDTKDVAFLLSITESTPLEHAHKQLAKHHYWWLRTPVENTTKRTYRIDTDGKIEDKLSTETTYKYARPAIWVKQ